MIYAFFYRALMRLAHRFDWHYAPKSGPMEDGSMMSWCHWCGLREIHPPKGARTAAGIMALRQEAQNAKPKQKSGS